MYYQGPTENSCSDRRCVSGEIIFSKETTYAFSSFAITVYVKLTLLRMTQAGISLFLAELLNGVKRGNRLMHRIKIG
jgi:hypothetical protein